jgi:uncharacterized protein
MRRLMATAVTVATLMGVCAATAAAQQVAEPPTLASVGVGRVFVRPDQARVYVSARRVAATSQEARRLANRQVREIKSALLELGVSAEDIRTVGVSVDRQRRRARRGRPARTVFSASSQLTVVVRDVDRVGAVVDALADVGGDVYGPEWSVTDPSGPTMEATRAALDDARRRAEDAAARIGHRITGIRAVDLAPGVGDFETEEGAGIGGGDAEIRIEPGREEIVSIVRVVYAIAPL